MRALPHLIPNRVRPRRSSVESGAGHRHEAPGLGDRKGAQEDGVDERKNGGVGSYAERERQHGRQREFRALSQRADRVSHVTAEIREPANGIDVAGPLLRERHVAESAQRGAAGLLARHAGADVFVGALVHVKAHFFV